jgi:hypothetical protein
MKHTEVLTQQPRTATYSMTVAASFSVDVQCFVCGFFGLPQLL